MGNFCQQVLKPLGSYTWVFTVSLCKFILNKFCCQSCNIIFPPKTVYTKKHANVGNRKYYYPANFQLKQIKTAK